MNSAMAPSLFLFLLALPLAALAQDSCPSAGWRVSGMRAARPFKPLLPSACPPPAERRLLSAARPPHRRRPRRAQGTALGNAVSNEEFGFDAAYAQRAAAAVGPALIGLILTLVTLLGYFIWWV